MDGVASEGSEARFAAYAEALGAVLGHADRQGPMRDYCLGLLMPIARKSVEPMAAVTATAQVAAKHQSLLHFVGNAPWSDAAMMAKSLPSRKRGWASWCCRRSSGADRSKPGSSSPERT
jgi:SRSO17 transposase